MNAGLRISAAVAATLAVLVGPRAARAETPAGLSLVRAAILESQPRPGVVRAPLGSEQLNAMRLQLAARGHVFSTQETAALSDVASAMLRENPSTLAEKVARGLDHRPAFHGQAAEFAEARSRGMVLTGDPRSTTWDLTQLRSRPFNSQVKVYADGHNAVRSALQDLSEVAKKMGGGQARAMFPQRTIDDAVSKGILKPVTGGYAAASHENVLVVPMSTMKSAAESRAYTARGQQALARLSGSQAPAPSATTALRPGMVAKPAALSGALTFAIDGGLATYKYETGQLNKSEYAEELQDSGMRAAAVGTATVIVYIVAATPAGWVVLAVSVGSYIAADAAISYYRDAFGAKSVAPEELRGIATSEFLDNLLPSLDDFAEGRLDELKQRP